MMAKVTLCPFCGEPVNPGSPQAIPKIRGWVKSDEPETILEPEPTGDFAHAACVAAAELAAPPQHNEPPSDGD
jgi:hypothetical protein